jgi:3-dehydrosphinganine reductase
MVREGVKGKIVFVASVLGYFSLVGYSTYSPGKFAVRGAYPLVEPKVCDSHVLFRLNAGLAEALQSEFVMYGIDIHICFPGTIFSPGLIEENKVKPKITLKLEESDDGAHPEAIAAYLLKGSLFSLDIHMKGTDQ